MPEVSVIVPARDAAATLGAALDALGAQTLDRDRFEAIVVDDASVDGTAELARSAGVTVVEGEGDGPAAARNLGAEAAKGEVLAFTDADCRPTPRWLEAGLAALGAADVVQGAVRPADDASPGPFDRTLWVDADRGLYQTANLLIRRDLFERLGGFESWLRPASGAGSPRGGLELGEDVLLGWRARRAGARVAFSAEALVHHAVHPGDAASFVAERRRLRHFPALVARLPELRDTFAYRRCFHSRRSAAFDLALAGALAAAWRRDARPLAAALPYGVLVAADATRWGRLAPRVALAGVAADAVACSALVRGSVEAGSAVL